MNLPRLNQEKQKRSCLSLPPPPNQPHYPAYFILLNFLTHLPPPPLINTLQLFETEEYLSFFAGVAFVVEERCLQFVCQAKQKIKNRECFTSNSIYSELI